MKLKPLGIIFILLHSSLFATVINGYAPAYKNTIVKLFGTEDYFSNKQFIIATTTTTDSGLFKFNIDILKSSFVNIKIEKSKIEFYIQPDGNYKMFIDKPKTKDENVLERNIVVDFGLKPNSKNDINVLIKKINSEIDSFFTVNYKYFLIKAAKTKSDSFRVVLETKYQNVADDFIRTHLRYNLASLDVGSYHSQKYLTDRYLLTSPNYQVPEYANFLKDIFKGKLQEFGETIKGKGLLEAINQQANVKTAFEKFKKFPDLLNDTLQELVFIVELSNYYYAPDCIKKNVLKCIGDMQIVSSFESNKLVAKNLYSHIVRFFKGSIAPDFELVDIKQKKVNLKDFKGKTIILAFGSSWSDTYISELKVLDHYQKQLGRKVVVLAIGIEASIDDLKREWKKSKLEFQLLSYVAHPEILEEYDVKAVPQFYIINKDGLFIEAPAQSPSKMDPGFFEAIGKLK